MEPSKIFINIGTNDIGFEIPEEEFLNNYDQILSQIESKLPQTQVYVMRYYPINTVDFGQDSDEKLYLKREVIKSFKKLQIK